MSEESPRKASSTRAGDVLPSQPAAVLASTTDSHEGSTRRSRQRAAGVGSSRLRAGDLLRVGTIGLRSRRLRTTLTALGIAIGIAAMVAVVGISSSSRADLLAELDSLGTDMLRVAPGQSAFGEDATLPESARATAERIGPVTQSAGITTGSAATVRRTDYIDEAVTSGISVAAADLNVLDAVSGELADGRFLDEASSRLPTVVLGADAARRLGITDVDAGVRVWLGDEWFVVIGILEPAPLAPELDSAALIGYPIADELFDTTRSPSTLYVRTVPDQVENVRAVLARSVDPDSPDEVDVSRPSDALEARAATDVALRNLLLALGAVALVVGGVGITNVMVISVLERRGEIGVRRALGARRAHIAGQFLAEAGVLAALGGIAGVGLGAAVTAIYARSQDWLVDVPVSALAAGAGIALAVGLLAGVSPAIRAARLDPAEALRPT
jgi:putative ABC transport system permease protein